MDDAMNMLNIEELDPDEPVSGGEEEVEEGEEAETPFMGNSGGGGGGASGSFDVGVEKDVTKDGGVKKTVHTAGSGWDVPKSGDEVSVHYVGTLASDGSQFDSSRDRGTPFTFTLGQGSVIKGWDVGVATMKRGERSKLRCAADYAYGARGHPPTIPGGATLDFDVELLSWKSVNDLSGDGGVVKKLVSAGEGYEKPGQQDEVAISYVLTNANTGEEVERSAEGDKVEFTLSEGFLCPAVKLGVASMKRGEEVELTVQPSYLFGDDGRGDALPGDATAIIAITLLSWKKVELLERDGSLVKKVLVEGTGYERPNEGATATVRYTARLEDGTVFETRGEGNELEFVTDEEAMPVCVDTAVLKMKKGETALVTSGPEWAFGDEGKAFGDVSVPSNASVTYEIELVDFVKAKESWDLSKSEKVAEAEKKKEDGNTLFKVCFYVICSVCGPSALVVVVYI